LRVARKIVSDGTPEYVHQFRTTSRRIETLITVHETELANGTDKLAKQLRRLRRQAGKVRDLDVQIGALRTVAVESITRDKSRLMSQLERARRKRHQKLAASVQKELDGMLQKRARKAQKQLQSVSAESAGPDYVRLALDRFSKAMHDFPALDENNLHDFRISCKRIRYLAELSASQEAKAIVAECKRAQDAIGEWHDWVMLIQRAEKLFPRNGSPLVAVLRTTQQTKLMEALRVTGDMRRKLLGLRAVLSGTAGPQPVPEMQMMAVAS
jgi:CHAD domain-containing protein